MSNFDITVRRTGAHFDVNVELGSTKLNVGFLDQDEAHELAEQLQGAVEELIGQNYRQRAEDAEGTTVTRFEVGVEIPPFL